jgi:hypothetical protein
LVLARNARRRSEPGWLLLVPRSRDVHAAAFCLTPKQSFVYAVTCVRVIAGESVLSVDHYFMAGDQSAHVTPFHVATSGRRFGLTIAEICLQCPALLDAYPFALSLWSDFDPHAELRAQLGIIRYLGLDSGERSLWTLGDPVFPSAATFATLFQAASARQDARVLTEVTAATKGGSLTKFIASVDTAPVGVDPDRWTRAKCFVLTREQALQKGIDALIKSIADAQALRVEMTETLEETAYADDEGSGESLGDDTSDSESSDYSQSDGSYCVRDDDDDDDIADNKDYVPSEDSSADTSSGDDSPNSDSDSDSDSSDELLRVKVGLVSESEESSVHERTLKRKRSDSMEADVSGLPPAKHTAK